MQLLLVRVKFTFHLVNWGAFLRIRYMAFRIVSDLFAALMLPEKYILDRVSFVAFLDAFELQPLSVESKKSSSYNQ